MRYMSILSFIQIPRKYPHFLLLFTLKNPQCRAQPVKQCNQQELLADVQWMPQAGIVELDVFYEFQVKFDFRILYVDVVQMDIPDGLLFQSHDTDGRLADKATLDISEMHVTVNGRKGMFHRVIWHILVFHFHAD